MIFAVWVVNVPAVFLRVLYASVVQSGLRPVTAALPGEVPVTNRRSQTGYRAALTVAVHVKCREAQEPPLQTTLAATTAML